MPESGPGAKIVGKMLGLLLAVCVLCLSVGSAGAGHGDTVKFQHPFRIGNLINDGIQDRDGFIWLSARGGLRRYDGVGLKVLDKASHGLSDNWITAILEDREGSLWVGTRTGGLNRRHKGTGRFSPYRHDPDQSASLSDNFVTCLYEDALGDLWVGTQTGGLNRLNREGGFDRYFHDPNDAATLSGNQILTVAGEGHLLWIGTGAGLDRMDTATGEIVRHLSGPDGSSGSDEKGVSAIEVDPRGLWVGTVGDGLLRYDKQSQTFRNHRHDPANHHSLSGNDIMDVFTDSRGILWIAHFNAGVSVYDAENDRFHRFRANTGDPFALRSNDVMRVFEDRSRNVWLLCRSGEVEKVDLKSKGFVHYRHETGNPKSLSSNVVLPVYEDRQETVWLATGNGGLNRYDRETDSFSAYKSVPGDPGTLRHLSVLGMYEDSFGNFWVSTNNLVNTALSLFDRGTGRVVRHLVHDPDDPRSLGKGTLVREILQDNRDPDTLWVTIDEFGLDRMDLRTGRFHHDFAGGGDSDGLRPSDRIWDLLQDDNHILWMATEGAGLVRLDTQTRRHRCYRNRPGDDESIGSNTVFGLHRSKTGLFWLATDNGLDRFDPETDRFSHYTTKHGLSDNTVYGIQEDKLGNLWISTNRGLCRFDPQTGMFRVYTASDGLQADAFFNRSHGQTRNGEMWFGGLNGVNRFRPEEIRDNPHVPNIVLTALNQGGEPIEPETDPDRIRSVSLNWRHNYFEFEYAALEYTRPEANRFKYMLEGMDQEWFDAGTRKFGRYTGIPAGDYLLRIVGSNNDGIWNHDGVSLEIAVVPPFWRTEWFYGGMIVALLLAAGIGVGYTARLRREIRRRQQAIRALGESETRYRMLAEHLPQRIFYKTPESVYVTCNENFARDLDIRENDIKGKTDSDFFPSDLAEKYRADDRRVIERKQVEEIEESFRARGRVKTVKTVKTPVTDETGRVVGILGIFWDITERKAAEDAIRRQNVYMATLHETALGLMSRLDLDEVLSAIVTRAAEFAGMPNGYLHLYDEEKDLLVIRATCGRLKPAVGFETEPGRGLAGMAWSERRPIIVRDFQSWPHRLAIPGFEKMRSVVAIPLLTRDRPLGVIGLAHEDPDRTVPDDVIAYLERYAQLVVIAIDNANLYTAAQIELATRKRLEKERNAMEAKLRRAQRMEALGTLAGGVAHDFNNLLMGVQGRVSLMSLNAGRDNPHVRHLREIESYIQMASELTGQLLGFARGGKYEVKTTDINSFVKECAEMFGRTRKQITLDFHLQDRAGPVEADRSQLNQVLLNLFVNAWQAMPTGGTLTVETENILLGPKSVSPYQLEPGQYVKISVSDTGVGMDKTIFDKIFDPFFTTKEMGRGTGLGLASAYGIVRNHDGFVTVYSEKGKGSTFNIYLPASTKIASAEKTAPRELCPGTETLLVVDDEAIIIDVATQMLQELGYRVLTADGGKSALQTYTTRKHEIALVILDMIMPGMGGGETFKELRRIDPDVKVILSSGYSINGQAAQILDRGCDGFIQKPFGIHQISKKIRDVLG